MTFPLTSLPPEIITLVLLHLDADSIVSLGKCIPLPITSTVYHHAFRDETRFSSYNFKLFEQRAQAKLFVLGDYASMGEDVDYDKSLPHLSRYYEFVNDGRRRRMHTPFQVCDEGKTIVQASLTDDSMHIVNIDGQLLSSKMYRAKPTEFRGLPYVAIPFPSRFKVKDDYEESRYEAQRIAKLRGFAEYLRQRGERHNDPNFLINRTYENWIRYNMGPILIPPPPIQVKEWSNRLYSQPYKPANFTAVSGEESPVALDDAGLLWTWPEIPDNELHWTPLCVVNKATGVPFKERILKAKTYFNYLVCLVEGIGIAKTSRGGLYVRVNGVRGGFSCFDDHCCYESLEIIPGTENARDFGMCFDDLFMLSVDGHISVVREENTAETFITEVEEWNQQGPFLQMVITDTEALLLNSDHRVMEVNMEMDDSRDSTIYNLHNVVAVAAGDTHNLALTENGAVYAWGMELHANGCMGMGRYKNAVKREGVEISMCEDNLDFMIISRPTRIKLRRKVFGIYASTNYSAFLMDSE